MKKEYTITIPAEMVEALKAAEDKCSKAHTARITYAKANPGPSEGLRNLCRDQNWAEDELDNLKSQLSDFVLEKIKISNV